VFFGDSCKVEKKKNKRVPSSDLEKTEGRTASPWGARWWNNKLHFGHIKWQM